MPVNGVARGQLPAYRGRYPLFLVDQYRWPTKYRILILGQTDSGKTYLAKRLLDQQYGRVPIVVYQSKPVVRSLDKLDVARTDKLSQLTSMIKRAKEPFIIYHPDPVEAQLRETTEEFCRIMLYAKGPSISYIDEVSHFTGFSPIPAKMFAAYITQGREMGKGIIMAGQEPAYLSRFIYAESQAIFRMYLHGGVNLKAIRDKLPTPISLVPLPPDRHALVAWDIRDREHAYPFRRCL